ncbi:MAG: CsbD family protein [Anaerolineae bacterium]
MSPQLGNLDWTKVRERIQERWTDLTEEDLARLDDRREALLELLQEKYGYARGQAEREVSRLAREVGTYTRNNTLVVVGVLVALLIVVVMLLQHRSRLSRAMAKEM